MDKKEIIDYFNSVACERDKWSRRNSYYHEELKKLIKFLIPQDTSVLDIGSSTGELLNSLKPSRGVGIDLSDRMVEVARSKFPHLEFLVQDAQNIQLQEKFDYVLVAGSLGLFNDVWKAFRGLKKVTNSKSRVVITYYNGLWEPILRIAEKFKLRMPVPYQNWLSCDDLVNLLYLNGYEVIKKGKRLIFPVKVPFISWFLNKVIANLPLLCNLCLIEYMVAKESGETKLQEMSCSVIVPCRNEAGNINLLLSKLPVFNNNSEVIFVDGYSTDGTVEEIIAAIPEYRNKFNIRLLHQITREDFSKVKENIIKENKMLKLGKADAVRKGFDAAKGDILIILDADCTVPPEDIPKFYLTLAESRGEFVNGTRLVYPLEKGAMRIFNLYANDIFGRIFSWLLGQKIKDTLCGTKALTK